MDICYSDPLHVDPSFLCLLYLVFAIGLVLAVPVPGTPEDHIIKRLRSDDQEWAERFYRSAKLLGDPVSGFEDADFWSIQALLLMSVYMLSISKRNAAYAYYGRCSSPLPKLVSPPAHMIRCRYGSSIRFRSRPPPGGGVGFGYIRAGECDCSA